LLQKHADIGHWDDPQIGLLLIIEDAIRQDHCGDHTSLASHKRAFRFAQFTSSWTRAMRTAQLALSASERVRARDGANHRTGERFVSAQMSSLGCGCRCFANGLFALNHSRAFSTSSLRTVLSQNELRSR
jgi:hypothetical protein